MIVRRNKCSNDASVDLLWLPVNTAAALTVLSPSRKLCKLNPNSEARKGSWQVSLPLNVTDATGKRYN